MNTCTLKFEATAFRNDEDNNLESLSASISVPVENDDEVIGNMLGNKNLIAYVVGELHGLVSYTRRKWMDGKDTSLTLDTYLDGNKYQSHSGLVTMKPEGFIFNLDD